MTDVTIVGYKPPQTFEELTDVQADYSGKGNYLVVVDQEESGLTFATRTVGDVTGPESSETDSIATYDDVTGKVLRVSTAKASTSGDIDLPYGSHYKINGFNLSASDVNAVATSLFDANTILVANTDDTPIAITIGENDIIGRLPSGNISGVTLTDLIEEESPASGDFLLGWIADGTIRKYDIGDLPFGSGDITTDDAWVAAGDLIVGTGENTASILTKGTPGYYLKAAESGLEWASVSGGSGDVSTDTIWDAAGDLAIGTGLDTAARLAKGSEGTLLRSGLSTLEWSAYTFPNSDGTDGQVLTTDGEGTLEWATPSSGGGITWNEVTSTSQSASADNGYIPNNADLVTLTLPETIAVGKTIRVAGSGAGGWKIAQNADQIIYFGDMNTTTGTGGYLASNYQYDAVELLCITADTAFVVISSMGDITVV